MDKQTIKHLALVLGYVAVFVFFVYQGMQAHTQQNETKQMITEKKQVVEQVTTDIDKARQSDETTKNVDLNDYDDKARNLALLMYNDTFTDEKGLTDYKNKVSKYVSVQALEQISRERTPTVWKKDATFPEYKVITIGRTGMKDNTITYLVRLAPKNEKELQIVLQMTYDLYSGTMTSFTSQRELKFDEN